MEILPAPATNGDKPLSPWLAMHTAWIKARMATFKHEFICKDPSITIQGRMDDSGQRQFRLACVCCGAHHDLPSAPPWPEAWAAIKDQPTAPMSPSLDSLAQ